MTISEKSFETLKNSVGFEAAMKIIGELQVGDTTKKGKVRRPLAAKADVCFLTGDFTDVESMVTSAVDQKAVIPFSAAYTVCFQDGTAFQSARIVEIIAAFEAIEQGASAVIVDSRGNHHPKVAAQHRQWLQAHGYLKLPGCK